MATLRIATLVKCCHRLIGRSGLYLHEISSIVTALVTVDLSGVDVFPRGCASQHVIDFFQFAVLSLGHFAIYIVYKRTCITGESVAVGTFLNNQNVAASRTKVKHDLVIKS
jgi:hypothetical protein